MTKENRNKILITLLLVGVGGGIAYAIYKLTRKGMTSGLKRAKPELVNPVTNIPCSGGTKFGCRTSPYGPRGGRMHWGMDIRTRDSSGDYNRNIVIKVPGEVVSAVDNVDNTGWGKRIGIKTDDGIYLLFAHLDNVFVRPGMRVYPFDIIGISGITSTPGVNVAPHVHFETCTDSCDNIPGGPSNYSLYKVNPKDYLYTWGLS